MPSFLLESRANTSNPSSGLEQDIIRAGDTGSALEVGRERLTRLSEAEGFAVLDLQTERPLALEAQELGGRVSVRLDETVHKATWRIVGGRVEVSASFGVDSAPLGLMASAPATVAREKLVEMAKRASRPQSSPAERQRFDVREVFR